MLRKFGPQGVIDATHGTNGYDFSLVTLIVIDEYIWGGLPCSMVHFQWNNLTLLLHLSSYD